MDIFFIAFCIIALWGGKIMRYNDEYIGRSTTTAVKGVFAILILFSHARQYPPPQYPMIQIVITH